MLQVIKEHSLIPAAVQQACRTLGNLAYVDDNAIAIAATGGIPVSFTTFKHHLSNPCPAPLPEP